MSEIAKTFSENEYSHKFNTPLSQSTKTLELYIAKCRLTKIKLFVIISKDEK